MTQAPGGDAPFVRSIFHPSDCSPESARAFAHALAIALARRGELTLLHVARDFLGEDEWRRFPTVRQTLERWGALQPGSRRSDVFQKLGVGVQKVAVAGRQPLVAILEFLEDHPTDLIVLATEGRAGVPAWLRQSLAERLARRSRTLTLFVPAGARGFVAPDDGAIALRRILVPVDRRPDPARAVATAARCAALAGGAPVEIRLLHVGEADAMPALDLPEAPGCAFERDTRQGEVVEQIEAAARGLEADLLVLATEGHEGILDALRGSVTEQVVRHAPCPVLAVPAA